MRTLRFFGPIVLIAIIGSIFLLTQREPPPSLNTALRETDVRAVCSGCHLFPNPSLLPRAVWRTQIEHMAFLSADPSLRLDGADFDTDSIVEWYESRAPEALLMEQPITRNRAAPLRFERRSIRLGRESGPGVSTIGRFDRQLVVPNMALGSIHLLSWAKGPRLIGKAAHPARSSAVDLDGDGQSEILIADLGDPLPTDEPTGRVLLARQTSADHFEFETVIEGIGRVSDVRPVDLDRDGDLDLVVAAFGYMREGGVYVLHNEGAASREYRVERVSERAGAVSIIPVHDLLPGWGPGFAVAFAQQHELVSVFVPGPDAVLEERVLHRAPHPAWGTSHLLAADLDADGDLDFLVSNGDTLDDGVAFKPYHGITWLENEGSIPFRAHTIGRLYGAQATDVADLDGDGDLDIVASAFLPQVELPVHDDAIRLDAVVWFEHEENEWIPWEIESGHPRHTGVSLVDFDEDGRLDIVAAVNRAWDVVPSQTGPSLEIWFNRGKR